MLDILIFLNRELSKLSPRVFVEDVPSDAIFPYLVVNMTSSTEIERDREDVIIEIDLWDIKKDGNDVIIDIERLSNEIDKLLRKQRFNGDNSVLIFTKIAKLSIPDTNDNIKRRQLRYVVKCYEKNI